MSLLPKEETDIFSLAAQGYSVTYEFADDRRDGIEEMVDFYNCIKEVVKDKDGVIDSPDDLPSVKYFDIKSKEIVGALWIKSGLLDREGAPAAVCERTTETGSGGQGEHYIVQGHYLRGVPHNANGVAFSSEELNSHGKMVKTTEDYMIDGHMKTSIRRDVETGNIIPEDCSIEDVINDLSP